MNGSMVTKDVTIDATVKAPDGSTTPEATRRDDAARGREANDAGASNGKWIITAIKPA